MSRDLSLQIKRGWQSQPLFGVLNFPISKEVQMTKCTTRYGMFRKFVRILKSILSLVAIGLEVAKRIHDLLK